MSDFKRKIEIVESTTPPPNKYNWWFDLNTDELKRYKNGNWELYNYNWPTTSLPPANEIWLYIEYCYDVEIQATAVKEEFDRIGTILDVEVDMREDESALFKIIFSKDLTNITVTEPIELDAITDSSLTIIFPNLDSIHYNGGVDYLFRGNESMFPVHFVFGEIKSISGCLLSVGDYYTNIAIYSKHVPTITSDLIDSGMSEGVDTSVHVSVPNALIKEYKSSTNWAQYDITSID